MTLATDYATTNVELFSTYYRTFSSDRDQSDVRDFEILLQIGCDTFDFLIRADLDIHKLVAVGDEGVWRQLNDAIRSASRKWLASARGIKQFSIRMSANGIELPSLEKFLRCYDEMEAIINFESMENDDDILKPPMAILRDQATEEFRLGKTEPFVP